MHLSVVHLILFPIFIYKTQPRYIFHFFRYSNPLAALNASGGGGQAAQPGEDLTPDYMNVLGMIFSMCALMMRVKWCAWVALYCSCISFANTKLNDDTKQIMSSFMCVGKCV